MLLTAAGMLNIGARLTWIDAQGASGAGPIYDFGNFAIPRDGIVIVASLFFDSTSNSLSSISIGGSAATFHSDISFRHTVPRGWAIASRSVGSGNHNVTVAMTSTAEACAAGVWLLENNKNATPQVCGGNLSPSNPINLGDGLGVLGDIPSGGIGLYACARQADNPDANWSWANATERADLDVDDDMSSVSFADRMGPPPGDIIATSIDGGGAGWFGGLIWR